MNIPIRKGDDTDGIEPALLSVPQARKKLGGISKWLLYKLLNSRQLESIHIRGRRFIPATSIEKYIERQLREDLA